jgi:ribonuclease VapC
LISAATVVELTIVAEARAGVSGGSEMTGLLRDTEVETVPVDDAIVAHAIAGWRRFGKGNHPAGLNVGDCFSYALAKHVGLPVLCVGDDFRRTAVQVVDISNQRPHPRSDSVM